MTVVAGSARLRNARENLPRESQETRLITRGANHRNGNKKHRASNEEGSESDTSISPITDFCNAPTYRIPVKHQRDIFRPDSSTESNNDQSPIRDRRSTNTPRHLAVSEKRPRSSSKVSRSQDPLQCNNR